MVELPLKLLEEMGLLMVTDYISPQAQVVLVRLRQCIWMEVLVDVMVYKFPDILFQRFYSQGEHLALMLLNALLLQESVPY